MHAYYNEWLMKIKTSPAQEALERTETDGQREYSTMSLHPRVPVPSLTEQTFH